MQQISASLHQVLIRFVIEVLFVFLQKVDKDEMTNKLRSLKRMYA